MTEEQIRRFASLKSIPIYDESDDQADAMTTASGLKLHECTMIQEIQDCLSNPQLKPLGGLRISSDGTDVVVVYFAEKN